MEQYTCATCRSPVSSHAHLISKAFQGRHGRAYAAQFWSSANSDRQRKFPHRPRGAILRRPILIASNSLSSPTRPRRSYLFASASNVSLGPKEDRVLLTGLHTVADIYCVSCETRLGWKYVEAFEPSQKYKEGRFIVEKIKIIEGNDL